MQGSWESVLVQVNFFFSKPPTDYVPDNVKSGNKCKKQIKVLLKSLGKGPATKSDELLEKFQTAFDPPPHFWKKYIAIFYDTYGCTYARRYAGWIV